MKTYFVSAQDFGLLVAAMMKVEFMICTRNGPLFQQVNIFIRLHECILPCLLLSMLLFKILGHAFWFFHSGFMWFVVLTWSQLRRKGWDVML